MIGIGIDLVTIEELRQSAEQQPGRYLSRVFTPREIAYAESQSDPLQCLAGKFAAKEACMKAFGTGWTDEIDWLLIEILNETGGKPFVVLHGVSAVHSHELGVNRILVSISHTSIAATAVVILEC